MRSTCVTRRVASVAAVIAATACSDESLEPVFRPAPGFQSGQRLRARYQELPGGVRLFSGFFDSERGEACAFQDVAGPGGVNYCLPATLLRPSSRWFADRACSDALVEVPTGVPASSVQVVIPPRNACEEAIDVRAVGSVVESAYYLSSTGNTCTASNPVAGGGFHVFGIGASVRDAFVRASERVEAVSDRIGALVLVADDGAQLTIGGYDLLRAESSVASNYEDSEPHWTPRQVAFTGFYHDGSIVYGDAACSRPTASKLAHSARCPITTVVEYLEQDDCGDIPVRLHASADPVAAEDLHYVSAEGDCAAIPDVGVGPFQSLYVTIGEELSPSTFAEATSVDVGEGRIVQRFFGSPDGIAVQPAFDLFDRTEGKPCGIATAADGVPRCLPPSGLVHYLDPACTQQILFPPAPSPCATAAAPPSKATDGFGGTVFEVLDELAPPAVYHNVDGACTELGPLDPLYRWYELGAEVPPENFERVTDGSD